MQKSALLPRRGFNETTQRPVPIRVAAATLREERARRDKWRGEKGIQETRGNGRYRKDERK